MGEIAIRPDVDDSLKNSVWNRKDIIDIAISESII